MKTMSPENRHTFRVGLYTGRDKKWSPVRVWDGVDFIYTMLRLSDWCCHPHCCCVICSWVGIQRLQLSGSLNNRVILCIVFNLLRHHGGAAQPGPPETGATGGTLYGRGQRQHWGQHRQHKWGNQSEWIWAVLSQCAYRIICWNSKFIVCSEFYPKISAFLCQGLTNNECSNHSFGSLGSSSDKESEVQIHIFAPIWKALWNWLYSHGLE